MYAALRENNLLKLMVVVFYILFAMAFGFTLFRMMGKAFQRMS
jgi:hypothetical protein